MDAVDKVFYENVTADEKLIGAYQFFATESGRLVLEDMLKQCYWGAQDPTVLDDTDAKSILAAQRVVWRIKAMLNATIEQEQGVEDE